MKTRIKIIEKNNGEKEYVCEKFKPDYDKIIVSIIGFIAFTLLAIFLDSAESVASFIMSIFMLLSLILFIGIGWVDLQYKHLSSSFSSIEEAKECIDSHIYNEKEKVNLENSKKIKKVSYLKYP